MRAWSIIINGFTFLIVNIKHKPVDGTDSKPVEFTFLIVNIKQNLVLIVMILFYNLHSS